ncbi:MAG: RHS repeat-associated core domain-containing protein, partial [Bacteroidetes bacterium]
DIHGSTRALVDTALSTKGRIKNDTAGDNGVQAFTYDAYGKLIATTFGATTQANALTSLLYSGEFTNAATGQQYLRARFYDPATGRFNRLDPFAGNISDPLSLHKYLYTLSNPIMGIDPNGRVTFSISGLASSIGVLTIVNGIVGGAVGSVRGGARGAVGGFLGAATATLLGYAAAAGFGALGTAAGGPLGTIGVALGFGFGGIAGAWQELNITEGSDYAFTEDGKIELGVAFAISTLLGFTGGANSLFLAKDLGQKILNIPSLRQEMVRAVSGSGVFKKSFVEFAEYYLSRPREFVEIAADFLKPELVESLKGAASSALTNFISGRLGPNTVYVFSPLILETTGAVSALFDNFNKKNP